MQTISDHRPVRMVLSRMRFLHIWICAFLADSYGGFGKKGVPENHPTGLFLLGNCKNQWFGTWDVHILGNLPCGFLWQRGYHKIPLKHGRAQHHFPSLAGPIPGSWSAESRRPWSISRWFSEENMVMFHGYVDFPRGYEILTSSWHPAGLLVFLLMEICAISVNESLPRKKSCPSRMQTTWCWLRKGLHPDLVAGATHTKPFERRVRPSRLQLLRVWKWGLPHNGCFSGHRIPNQWIQG